MGLVVQVVIHAEINMAHLGTILKWEEVSLFCSGETLGMEGLLLQ
jgi:hypothetical protein